METKLTPTPLPWLLEGSRIVSAVDRSTVATCWEMVDAEYIFRAVDSYQRNHDLILELIAEVGRLSHMVNQLKSGGQ